MENWLSEKFDRKCKILSYRILSGGACLENVLLDITFLDDQENIKLVYRSDAGSSLSASLPREIEFQVASLAYKRGVKTPKPYFLETSGKKFYIMEALEGKSDVRYITKDPSLNSVRYSIVESIAENLAKIHSITFESEDIFF